MATSDTNITLSNMIASFYDKKLLSKLEASLNLWPSEESEWVRWSKDYFQKKGLLKC